MSSDANKISMDLEKAFVQEKIEKCSEDVNKVYALGLVFRDGKIEGYPKGTAKSARAAFKCFQHASELGLKTPQLYHNLGIIYYYYSKQDKNDGAKHLGMAKAAFMIASNGGLSEATRNLHRIAKEEEEENKKVAQKAAEAEKMLLEEFSAEKIQAIAVEKVRSRLEEMGLPPGNQKSKALETFVLQSFNTKVTAQLGAIQQQFTERNKAFLSGNNSQWEKSFQFPTTSISAAQVSEALFTELQLKELKRVATVMFERTKPEDCLLFSGRSPLWIAEMFKTLQYDKERQILCVPCSGVSNLGKIAEIPQAAFIAYEDFLKSRGLNASLFDKNPNRKLYIIDRIESGMSVMFFKRLLTEITPKFNENNTLTLGFGHEKDRDGKDFIVMEDSTLIETCKKHGSNQVYTLGVDFHPDEWQNWKKKDFAPQKSEIVIARQAQIADWVQKASANKSRASSLDNKQN